MVLIDKKIISKLKAGGVSPNIGSTILHSLFISSFHMTDINQDFKKQDCINFTPKVFQEHLGWES